MINKLESDRVYAYLFKRNALTAKRFKANAQAADDIRHLARADCALLLHKAFDWAATPEKEKFWFSVYEALATGTNIPTFSVDELPLADGEEEF